MVEQLELPFDQRSCFGTWGRCDYLRVAHFYLTGGPFSCCISSFLSGRALLLRPPVLKYSSPSVSVRPPGPREGGNPEGREGGLAVELEIPAPRHQGRRGLVHRGCRRQRLPGLQLRSGDPGPGDRPPCDRRGSQATDGSHGHLSTDSRLLLQRDRGGALREAREDTPGRYEKKVFLGLSGADATTRR